MKKRILALFEKEKEAFTALTIKELLEKLKPYPEGLKNAYAIIEEMESEASGKAQSIAFADSIPKFLKEKNLKSAILTNNSRTSVTKYLLNNKISYLQDIGPIITRDDVSTMKPDPAGLIYILNRFNLQKDNVLFIGDSYIDADAAYRINIPFILVNYRNLSLDAFSEFPPLEIFSNLHELILFLREFMTRE